MTLRNKGKDKEPIHYVLSNHIWQAKVVKPEPPSGFFNNLKQLSSFTIQKLRSLIDSSSNNQVRDDRALFNQMLATVKQEEELATKMFADPSPTTDDLDQQPTTKKERKKPRTRVTAKTVQELQKGVPLPTPFTGQLAKVDYYRGKRVQGEDEEMTDTTNVSINAEPPDDQNLVSDQQTVKEEPSPILYAARSKTIPVPLDLSIEEADEEDYETMEAELSPDIKDYNECPACRNKFKGAKSYIHHLAVRHNMTYFAYGKKRPLDAPFYCKWCHEAHSKPKEFRVHLIMAHKLLKVTKGDQEFETVVHQNTQPNVHDPYFHCAPCQVTFLKVGYFRKHLKRRHDGKMTPKVKSQPSIKELRSSPTKPELNNPNYHCTICKRYYTKNKFRWHLYHQHVVIHPEIEGFFEKDRYGDYTLKYAYDLNFDMEEDGDKKEDHKME